MLFFIICLQSLAAEKKTITEKQLELFASPKKGNILLISWQQKCKDNIPFLDLFSFF